MKLTLPVTKYVVELFDFIPQDVFEKYQEMVTPKDLIVNARDAMVTIDRIAEELGPDRALAIQNADENAKAVLMEEARREILMKSLRITIDMTQQHQAERERCKGMIKEVREGEEVVLLDLGTLPTRDYAYLQRKITKIESQEEDLGKSEGQSDA